MFRQVVIDETKDLSTKQARIASCLEFVAEDTITGIFYTMKDWFDLAVIGSSTTNIKPTLPRVVYLSKREYYENGETWNNDDGKLNVKVPERECIISFNPMIRKGALEQQGLSATTAILILAASGIDIALPNASFDRTAAEEIARIKQSLADERIDYLLAVSKMADESFNRLNSGHYKDVFEWAANEATFKILPKAKLLEGNLSKLDKSLLERAIVQFWKEGVPAIGKALVTQDRRSGLKAAAEEAIKVMSVSLAKGIEQKKTPEANYILKLSQELL